MRFRIRFCLNHAQREGLAKVFDNLATALLVAAVVGGFVDHKLAMPAGFVIVTLALVLILTAVKLRKGTSDVV